MPIPAFRAKQSTDTIGTGTLVLNAAATNARSFNAAFGASARRIMYCISWATGFEIGYGDFDGGTPGSLTRATVLASSNAGSLVTLPAGTKDVFAVFDPAAREVISISATATLALADLGNAVIFTGASAATLNLPAVATAPLGAGWVIRNAGTAALTIDPNGAETINGAATLALQPGASAILMRSGSAWDAAVMENATAEVDIASAATTEIGATASQNIRITGTTTITAFGAAPNGVTRQLRFAAALTLTHNATSLILPGGANISTAAGDTATAISLGSGNWIMADFMPASGWCGSSVVLAEAIANNSASLDLTGVFSNTYDRYELELLNLLPAVDDGTMILRVGTGAGPTWQSGSSYNNAIFGITDSSSGIPASLTTAIYLSWSGGSGAGVSNVAATGGVSGRVSFCNPEVTTIYPSFDVETRHIYATGPRVSSIRGSGIYAGTAAITGLRVLSSLGNITSGSIRLLGYRK
jgi:hypothetical protein